MRYTAFALIAAPLLAGCGDNLLQMASRPTQLGCCGIVILVLDIIAIIEIAGSSRTLGSKILWVLIIFFVPIVGLVVYYVFERN